jgi:hypothetical protein
MDRKWMPVPKPLPQGVARGWMALEHGYAVAAIFEVMAGGVFMLSYHVYGEAKPRIERFPSFDLAQSHANRELSRCKVIPRTVPGTASAA